MKTLILWVVMLTVIGLCAISANADLLIDSFNYPSNAALQAAYNPWDTFGTTIEPTIATNNGTPCADTYVDYTDSAAGNGVYWYKNGSWDLTGCTGLTLSMAATNPSQIYYAFVILGSDSGGSYFLPDYNVGTYEGTETGQLQPGFCPLSWGGVSGSGTMDWANVNVVQYGYCLNPNGGAGDVYIADLIANGVTPRVVTPVISPNGPNYAATVSITCATAGATIMYTTDSHTPTLTYGTQIASGNTILVNQACTVQAAAFLTGDLPSPIAQASFTTHNNLLIDSFNYPSNAALQAVWTMNSDFPTSTITMATVGGVPCLDMYDDNTGYKYDHMYCYETGSWDLSGCTGVTYSLAASDPTQILYPYIDIYMDNNTSDFDFFDYNFGLDSYGTNTLTANQLQTGTCLLASGSATGTMDWTNVSKIVVGYYTNWETTGPSNLYVSDLIANGVVQASAPVFSPDGGTCPATVTATCANSGATIAYTTGGSIPTKTNGTQVASGATISISQTTILKAAAWAAGYAVSPVTEAAFAPAQGNVPYANSVTMDGNLGESPWSSATWTPINQIYLSWSTPPVWPDDITSAQWTAFWSNDGNTIYVGVEVLDTQWTFSNAYNGGNSDHVESVHTHHRYRTRGL